VYHQPKIEIIRNIRNQPTFSMHDFRIALTFTIVFSAFLSSVVLLNGFPLVFSDSGTYLWYIAKEGTPLDRPVFYSWLLGIFTLNTKLPIFSIIASQALISSTVIYIFLKCLQITKTKSRLILALFLTTATSLPWFAGQLMPDFFLGLGLLSAYTLIYYFEDLNNSKRIFLFATFITTCLVHNSNTPVLLSTLFIFLIAYQLHKNHDGPKNKHVLTRTLLLMVLALTALTINHLQTKSQLKQTPTAHFLVNRLVDDGIIQKLLNEHCADTNYILCPYKDKVQSSYLWGDSSSPFMQIRGFNSPAEESWKMIIDSLIYYPFDHILSSTKNTVKQVFSFNTGDGLGVYSEKTSINRAIKKIYPSDYIDFASSRQQQGTLKKLLSFIAPIHNIVIGISFAILLLTLLYKKNHARSTSILTIFILSAIISNAAICGIFAGVYDRYQSRIIWLIPFAAAILIIKLSSSKASIEESNN
jgi:hypothetical protein